jgi:hypothetical protein
MSAINIILNLVFSAFVLVTVGGACLWAIVRSRPEPARAVERTRRPARSARPVPVR